MKLSNNSNGRSLLPNGTFIYQTDHTPDEIDSSPEYFDKIVMDVIDPDKYIHSPLSSGVGTTFSVVSGDVKAKYHIADFRVDGVKTNMNASGVKTYELFWTRCSSWSGVNNARAASRRNQKEKAA